MHGTAIECTLWRGVYSRACKDKGAPPGHKHQESVLFVTADPSGDDATEVLGTIAHRAGHTEIELHALERISLQVRGTALRVGADAWSEGKGAPPPAPPEGASA